MSRFGRTINSISIATLVAASLSFSFTAPGWADLNEISVDVGRRGGTRQHVPVAVDVLSLEQIERLSINDIRDIVNLSPSMQFDEGASQTDLRIVIRGLSPTQGGPNVATIVDGIDISSEAIGFPGSSLLISPRLIDIQRVEIIKGPQGTIYGPNAFNGAIQYITKDPTEDFNWRIAGDAGIYGRYEGALSASGAVVEDLLALRIEAAYWHEQGFTENTATSADVGGGHGWASAITAKFKPTNTLSFKARIEYADDTFEQSMQGPVAVNGTLSVPSVAAADNDLITPGIQSVVPVNPGLDISAGVDPRNGQLLFTDTMLPSVIGTLPNADEVMVRYSPNFVKSGGMQHAFSDYPGSERTVFRVSLVADWNVGIGTISSLTHYADVDVDSFLDMDKRATGSFATARRDETAIHSILSMDNETMLYSQELRFASDWDHPVQLTLGGLRWSEDVEQTERGGTLIGQGVRCDFGDCPGFTSVPVFEFVDDFFAAQPARPIKRETDHWSAYGWLELDLKELNWIPESLGDWTISAQARYVRETHELSGPTPTAGATMGDFTLCGPNLSCVALVAPLDFTPDALVPGPDAPDGFTLESFKRTDNFVTPKVLLEWRPSDEALIYASYTLAKKPGGFSTLGVRTVGLDPNGNGLPDETEFGTEKMHVYELGAKTSWFDNTLSLNGSLFYQDFTEKQATTTEVIGGALSQVYTNDAQASVFGIEVDARWQPDEHWSFSGYYTFLDTEYDELTGLTGNPNTIAASGCEEVVGLSTSPMTYQCLVDRSGNELERAPKHSFVGFANYTAPFIWGDIDWFVEGDGRYQGKRFLTADNIVQLDSYFEVNVRIGFKSERWDILAFADNVLDNDTIKSAYIAPDLVGPSVFRDGASATESVSSPKLVNGVIANLPDPFRYGVRAAIHF